MCIPGFEKVCLVSIDIRLAHLLLLDEQRLCLMFVYNVLDGFPGFLVAVRRRVFLVNVNDWLWSFLLYDCCRVWSMVEDLVTTETFQRKDICLRCGVIGVHAYYCRRRDLSFPTALRFDQ